MTERNQTRRLFVLCQFIASSDVLLEDHLDKTCMFSSNILVLQCPSWEWKHLLLNGTMSLLSGSWVLGLKDLGEQVQTTRPSQLSLLPHFIPQLALAGKEIKHKAVSRHAKHQFKEDYILACYKQQKSAQGLNALGNMPPRMHLARCTLTSK